MAQQDIYGCNTSVLLLGMLYLNLFPPKSDQRWGGPGHALARLRLLTGVSAVRHDQHAQ